MVCTIKLHLVLKDVLSKSQISTLRRVDQFAESDWHDRGIRDFLAEVGKVKGLSGYEDLVHCKRGSDAGVWVELDCKFDPQRLQIDEHPLFKDEDFAKLVSGAELETRVRIGRDDSRLGCYRLGESVSAILGFNEGEPHIITAKDNGPAIWEHLVYGLRQIMVEILERKIKPHSTWG
jgi:hypothetical protein